MTAIVTDTPSPAKACARKNSRSCSSGAAAPASACSRRAPPRCATKPIPSAWCCRRSRSTTSATRSPRPPSASNQNPAAVSLAPRSRPGSARTKSKPPSAASARKQRQSIRPTQTLRSIKLYHRQVYAYAYHRSKLTLLRRNPQHQRFEALATFLENIPSTCPHELFRGDDDPKARASQARLHFADPTASSSIAKRTQRRNCRPHHSRRGF